MSKLSKYIIILCAEFNDSCKPLTRAAFWKLYHMYNDCIEDLINSDEAVIKRLLERSNSIDFAIEKMSKSGITITTFLDEDFPHKLYKKLEDFCPPIFYKAGNSELNKYRFAGYTGSRNINGSDELWTRQCVKKNIKDKYAIVTGGAKGIDTIALNTCIENNGCAVLFLPNNISAKIQEPYIRKNIANNRVLVYSHVSPFAVKTPNSFARSAIERNKFIYAISAATVVVRADKNKGGTWSGATEALKHKWSYVYVWDNKEYNGNQALIQLGALPLTDDGNMLKDVGVGTCDILKYSNTRESNIRQLSIYDMM